MKLLSILAVTFSLTALLVGCGEPTRTAKNSAAKKGADEKKHDDWWCQEHGVPEHLCSQCSDEVAAKCKKEGDWCKIHPDRAKSQCFKCDPTLYKKFEDMYVAKYGKKPDPPPEDEFKN